MIEIEKAGADAKHEQRKRTDLDEELRREGEREVEEKSAISVFVRCRT
jgi:hypothetical protein